MKILKNISWHLFSNVFPFLSAIYFLPKIILLYGRDEFAVISLAWAALYFFVMVDGGLGRSLTYFLAIRKNNYLENQSKFFFNALVGSIFFSLVFIIFIVLFGDYFIKFLNLSQSLYLQASEGLFFFIFLIPLIVLCSLFKGVLEAQHMFKETSIIRMIDGFGLFFFPYFFAIYKEPTLYFAFLSFLFLRVTIFTIYLIILYKNKLVSIKYIKFDKKVFNKLISFGGWVSVSSFIQPLMILVEKTIAIKLISAFYFVFFAAPFEVLSKFNSIATSVSVVLFPNLINHNKSLIKQKELCSFGFTLIILIIFPILLLINFFSNKIIEYWLGIEFLKYSADIVIILASGILINSLASIPYILLQSKGRADLTAKYHIFQILPVIFLYWLLADKYGVIGIAYAWAIKVFIDYLLQMMGSFIYFNQFRTFLLNELFFHFLMLIILFSFLFSNNKFIDGVLLLLGFLFYSLVIYRGLKNKNIFYNTFK